MDCLKNRRLLSAENEMTFGPTHPALDNLTYFEEQLLSPMQPGAAGLGKTSIFLLKSLRKLSILSAGAAGERPGSEKHRFSY